MSSSQIDPEPHSSGPEALPFAAPCAVLETTAPLRWVALGWRDFRRAPRTSLYYGGFLVLVSYVLTYVTWKLGGYVLILSLASGFVFIAPVLALGLYSISCQLERDLKPQIGYCLREGRRHLGDELVFSAILLIVALVWARAASMVHVFFPMESEAGLREMLLFLGIGTGVGAIFTAVVFSASAFSLPMMLDRKVDTVTAVVTSVHAVLQNKLAMLVWAIIVGLSLLVSFATAFLGLAVLMPVLGYATWHGYRETIQAQAWPENSKLPLAERKESEPG